MRENQFLTCGNSGNIEITQQNKKHFKRKNILIKKGVNIIETTNKFKNGGLKYFR